MNRIGTLTAILEAAYNEEEDFWRERSRILWLQCGDRNTAYVHAETRGRRAINKLSVIEDREGTAVYKEDEIVKSITDFYSSIFTTQMSNSSSPLVAPEMNKTLIAPPTPCEIMEALFSIHPEKAPGPDGFSASFYQSFWDILGAYVVSDIQDFFATGTFDSRQNETRVRLIPRESGGLQTNCTLLHPLQDYCKDPNPSLATFAPGRDIRPPVRVCERKSFFRQCVNNP